MVKQLKFINVVLFALASVSLIVGIVFLQQGVTKYMLIQQLARTELVTTGINPELAKGGDVVDTLDEMQAAADVIRGHRQGIALTYGDLLGPNGRFDPTNPKHITYGQAINLENYLYLGSLSFGTTLFMMGVGAFMLLVALALGLVAWYMRLVAINT
jgi:hypothetical protein